MLIHELDEHQSKEAPQTYGKMKIDPLKKPIYIAHRGYKNRFPENTLAAFQGAVDAGAEMIELDVTLSKDRRLVVIHDNTVDRTTDGSGAVKALTLKELTRLDAGSWFDPKFENERLPTLAQVLETVQGRLMVNIEIKPEAFEPNGLPDSVERQVMAVILEYEMVEKVLVSSFHWPILDNFRSLSPTVALGLLSESPANEDLLAWCKRINCFSWHPDFRILTRRQVNTLHELGVHVFPYTVDGKMDTRIMIDMGVDGLIVDDPGQMTVNVNDSEKGDK